MKVLLWAADVYGSVDSLSRLLAR